MADAPFVYVTYIHTTPERLWEALTNSEFTRRYWSGTSIRCDWGVGARLTLVSAEGDAQDTGEVLEYDPPRRLSYTWLVGFIEAMKAEGHSRVTFELEPVPGAVKLTLTHDRFPNASKVREAVSTGWPAILSSLKTLMETGSPLPSGTPEEAAARRAELAEQHP